MSVPESCCRNIIEKCGDQVLADPSLESKIYIDGCQTTITNTLKKYLIAVGAVAAAVGVLEIIGIIFAFCLASCLRKDYRVV